MIHLFPKLKNRMLLICACYIALVGVYIALNKGRNMLFPFILTVVGLVIVVISQLLTAFNVHSQLLAKLYNHMDVEGFLRQYEPKLNLKISNENVALMARLHVSNAYCAQGRFDEAKNLLHNAVIPKGKKQEDELLSRFAITSNLCYFSQLQEDLPTARTHMNELLSLKKQLEALQQSKPEKKRMVFNTELNEQVMKYLETGKADIEALRKLVQNNSQQLHKVTISLWIARAYLAENNRREAVALLEKIVKLAPHLYPGKVAADILGGLPAKSEENE